MGQLERECGEAYSPQALLEKHLGQASSFSFAPPERPREAEASAAAEGLPAATADSAPSAGAQAAGARSTGDEAGKAAAAEPGQEPSKAVIKLEVLINFLEEEVEDKELRKRAAECKHPGDTEVLFGHGLDGQAALDAYVSELVTMIRDFPFDRLEGGKEAGAWVRDEVVAPHFRGRWNFYSNKKHGAGFDMPALDNMLNGENRLLASLRFARLKAAL